MSTTLTRIAQAVEGHNDSVVDAIQRARTDSTYASELKKRWDEIRAAIPMHKTPTGIELPRLALPHTDEPAEIARFLVGEGLPGEYPFLNGVYREQYLEPLPDADGKVNHVEEPTRLFAGLGLSEDTNDRFHFITRSQRTIRLSTAFDGPTLYGMDSDADGVFGKIGEGGVAVDTVEDMERLYAGFEMGQPNFSASLTINGPAPAILAMYVAAARRRFGPEVVGKLRGTVQADVLKEIQAQNECLFPMEDSLRFLGDMAEFCNERMPRFYPISISGYHIAEAGATPVQQAAYTLSNGFTYVELFQARGMKLETFGPRLSFFLDCGLDIEYLALARVCRKIWAVGMKQIFNAGHKAQMLKLHTQTSGRSLIAAEFRNNVVRTAAELMIAYMNATNSSHSNSADEPFTTPSEDYVRLAAHSQAILLEESGFFKHMMNTFGGAHGMQAVERQVEKAILEEFREIDRLGGVLRAVEHRYQRSQIQHSAHRMEQQIYDGTRPVIGLNRLWNESTGLPEVEMIRTPRKQKELQVARLGDFKRRNADKVPRALERLTSCVENGGNVFAELIEAVEVCSLGQITECLHETVGHFRPTV